MAVKRDFDLLRKIILEVGNSNDRVRQIEGVSPEVFSLHAKLLEDAGLVENSKHAVPNVIILRLTYKGHDALEALQESDSINWSNLVACTCR
jgi:DNA-binding HxlR family transcriptional regulator